MAEGYTQWYVPWDTQCTTRNSCDGTHKYRYVPSDPIAEMEVGGKFYNDWTSGTSHGIPLPSWDKWDSQTPNGHSLANLHMSALTK